MGSTSNRKALEMVRYLPRVSFENIRDNPGAIKKHRQRGRGGKRGGESGRGRSGQGKRDTRPPIGYEGGTTPFYLRIPMFPFYKNFATRRQYLPVSMRKLQHLIDMGRINPEEPIDVTSFVHSGAVKINVLDKVYGIHLTDEGVDTFETPINIEVQWSSELSIAAIERCGGVFTLGYYDPQSLDILAHPLQFFRRGRPIPKRLLPPKDLVDMYTDPAKRGYLADPEKIREERLLLAQKFGYELPDITRSSRRALLQMRKDPRQIFFGLQPGWFVNMTDKTVIKPLDEELNEYYKS
ncbi:39S ribosomal protein L15, mitochondrial [Holothuria leucospilota]|uniref:Large ribosomal subunit protein uL15m n=1 Tax=Holothuria leucospilota TaxID=206669 RepID=A0A9Q1H2X8_HOLLE|nr:39S ribosomal protein L15, mitochondrial [Holothuria leucospilota]